MLPVGSQGRRQAAGDSGGQRGLPHRRLRECHHCLEATHTRSLADRRLNARLERIAIVLGLATRNYLTSSPFKFVQLVNQSW